ncbi:Aladin [Thalictrum thalictroides]|uniref:Aladin n=1 Tax=Thalictrum thalictroides TaxID=46969 RepID=A0A7J6W1B8_THATH|nr:Aladin [Thalictrum thalictroides]
MSVDAMIPSSPAKSQLDEQQQRIPHLLQCKPLYEQEINLLAEVDIQEVSWHQHKHILAFISGPNQVTVQDFDDSDGKDPCIIISDSQRGIKVLEWRPNGGKTLSVACKGGICIWSASYPGNAASVRSGVASFVGTFSKGSGVRWTLVDFLRTPNEEQISSISWSPDGRYPVFTSIYMLNSL